MISTVCLSRHISIGLMALIVVLLQMVHPWMHPHEVIGSDASDQLACPMSHVVGELYLNRPPLAPGLNILDIAPEPRPWFGRNAFFHPLAPRPPPVIPA